MLGIGFVRRPYLGVCLRKLLFQSRLNVCPLLAGGLRGRSVAARLSELALQIQACLYLLCDFCLRSVRTRLRLTQLSLQVHARLPLSCDFFVRRTHLRLRIRDLTGEPRMHVPICGERRPCLLQLGVGIRQGRIEGRDARAGFSSRAGFGFDARFERVHTGRFDFPLIRLNGQRFSARCGLRYHLRWVKSRSTSAVVSFADGAASALREILT